MLIDALYSWLYSFYYYFYNAFLNISGSDFDYNDSVIFCLVTITYLFVLVWFIKFVVALIRWFYRI